MPNLTSLLSSRTARRADPGPRAALGRRASAEAFLGPGSLRVRDDSVGWWRKVGVSASLVALTTACTVGPNYVRPITPVTNATFKEAAAQGFRPARPSDAIDRGAWWSIFQDPVLDSLIRRIDVSNQNLRAAEAAYRLARNVVSESRAAAFPTLGLSGSAQRSKSGGARSVGGTIIDGGSTASAQASAVSNYTGTLGLSWSVDVWGRIRRTVESNSAAAQASAADLASARLSAQAELASDYLQLRVLDEQQRLYDATVAGYRRALQLVENQYKVGVVARADVITAQTQLRTAEAAAQDVAIQRAGFEHAIAVLVGLPPSQLTIAAVAAPPADPPEAPAAIASGLLERRPDVASAERRVAAANADIGIATAAFYPDFSLSADVGVSGARLAGLFTEAASFWSLGANIAQTLVDFGARRARLRQARAQYDQVVAQYRQLSLQAFASVEDQLVTLRVLREEATTRAQALALARQAEALALNQYRAGLVNYATVVQAQATALSAAQTTLGVRNARLTATVSLIEALGGGWDETQLPKDTGGVSLP